MLKCKRWRRLDWLFTNRHTENTRRHMQKLWVMHSPGFIPPSSTTAKQQTPKTKQQTFFRNIRRISKIDNIHSHLSTIAVLPNCRPTVWDCPASLLLLRCHTGRGRGHHQKNEAIHLCPGPFPFRPSEGQHLCHLSIHHQDHKPLPPGRPYPICIKNCCHQTTTEKTHPGSRSPLQLQAHLQSSISVKGSNSCSTTSGSPQTQSPFWEVSAWFPPWP